MSAFGGKADMTVCGCLLSRSLLGVKRTLPFAVHMSAFDPKRTFTTTELSYLPLSAWRAFPQRAIVRRKQPSKIGRPATLFANGERHEYHTARSNHWQFQSPCWVSVRRISTS